MPLCRMLVLLLVHCSYSLRRDILKSVLNLKWMYIHMVQRCRSNCMMGRWKDILLQCKCTECVGSDACHMLICFYQYTLDACSRSRKAWSSWLSSNARSSYTAAVRNERRMLVQALVFTWYIDMCTRLTVIQKGVQLTSVLIKCRS